MDLNKPKLSLVGNPKSLKKLIQEYSNNATSAIESLNPKFSKTSDLLLLSEFLLKRNY